MLASYSCQYYYQTIVLLTLPFAIQGLLCIQCDKQEKNSTITDLCLHGQQPATPCPRPDQICITHYYRSCLINQQLQEPFTEEKVTWRNCGTSSAIGCKIHMLNTPKKNEAIKENGFHSFVVSPQNQIKLRPGEIQVCTIGCYEDGCVLKLSYSNRADSAIITAVLITLTAFMHML